VFLPFPAAATVAATFAQLGAMAPFACGAFTQSCLSNYFIVEMASSANPKKSELEAIVFALQ
jgi:hypothetical protein